MAQSDIDWMRAWARRPDTLPEIVLADWSWLPGWFAALPKEAAWPMLLQLAALLAVLLLARLACGRRLVTARDLLPGGGRADLLVLLGVAVAGIAFWFATAPLVRYGQAWLVLPLLLPIAHGAPVGWRGAVVTERLLAWPRLRGVVAGTIGLAVLAGLAGHPPRRLLGLPHPPLPAVATESRGDLAGLPVHVPARGDQCWDAPRLCTPHLRDHLVARRLLWSWIVVDPG